MELEKVTVTFEIEPVALTILRHQAEWQHVTLDQLAAQYIGRCAAVVEQQHGNALVSDAFDHLIERSKAPKEEPEPVYKRIDEVTRLAESKGFTLSLDSGSILLLPRNRNINAEIAQTFRFNDEGLQVAKVWLEAHGDQKEG
jgi:hypothetical protein